MEHRFKADEWERLTPAERVRRCRAIAAQAREIAATAPSTMRDSYLRLAESWALLADEIERSVN